MHVPTSGKLHNKPLITYPTLLFMFKQVTSHASYLPWDILTEVVYGYLQPNTVHLYKSKIFITRMQKVSFLSSRVQIHSGACSDIRPLHIKLLHSEVAWKVIVAMGRQAVSLKAVLSVLLFAVTS